MAYDASGKLLGVLCRHHRQRTRSPADRRVEDHAASAAIPNFTTIRSCSGTPSPATTKATIKPGPNNPVGLVWIDLSKSHYGIHGTPEPSRIGHTTSHGCIRLTNWDAAELASMVKPGMPAFLKE